MGRRCTAHVSDLRGRLDDVAASLATLSPHGNGPNRGDDEEQAPGRLASGASGAAAGPPGNADAKGGGGGERDAFDAEGDLDALIARLGRSEHSAAQLASEARAVRAEVALIQSVLGRIEREVAELREAAAAARRAGAAPDAKQAAAAMDGISAHQARAAAVCARRCPGP